jgi:glycosyltransferase 2 family protein
MKRLSHLVRLLPAAAALGLFVFTLRNADLGHSLALIGSVGVALPPLLTLPYLVTIAIESFGWRLTFVRLGRALPFIGLVKVRLTAEAFAMGLPSGNLIGESLQPYLLKRRCQAPFEEGAAGVVARKFFMILSQGLFLALSAVIGYPTLQRVSVHAIGRPGLPWVLLTTSAVLLVVAATLAAVLVYGRVAQRSRRALERLGLAWLSPWLERNARKFHDTDAHLARFFSQDLGGLVPPLVSFLGMWLAKSLESALVLRLLGVPLAFSSVMAFETALTLGRSLLVPVPGGLGVQDLGYILCLHALDVPDAQSVGAAFVLLKRAKEAIWMAVGFALLPSGVKRLAAGGSPGPVGEPGQAANTGR